MLFLRRVRFMLAACAVLSLGTAVPSRADIVFTLGNHPQTDEENILFGAKETGTTVTGATNKTGVPITFISTTDTLVQNAKGQAKIEADDGALNNISIFSTGNVFTDFILNPVNGSGTATVTVTDNLGGTSTFTYPSSGNGSFGNGNNFLTITTTNAQKISLVTLNAADGFVSFEQPRISGLQSVDGGPPVGGGGGEVPEPGALSVLAAVGLVRLSVLRSRRRQG
ncbi:MAG TPA: hypothetical protein VFB21_19930 [Chthonomonadaceae bacterium]|nr:hypothetical protein [Chthonomonadaceae bacterium]